MKDELEFLFESNKIEGVYDADSLMQAWYAWEDLKSRRELSFGAILKMHKILMLHQKLDPDEKGYFRTCTVYIGSHVAMSPFKIRDALAHWLKNFDDVVLNGQRESKIFLKKITKEHHVKYEKIHPFVDGNGRTGRMLYNWQRLKTGLPIHIIHQGEEQQEYYEWFR